MFKLIIAGGRDFKDYPLLKKEVDTFFQDLTLSGEVDSRHGIEIVSGKQVTMPDKEDESTWYGADYLGEKYAKFYNIPVKPFPADWNGPLKRGAGHARNIEMADYADALIAFWDGKSPGTGSMIKYAKERGLIVRIIYYS